jgi:ADP-ribosyl-[dinitrogen reductase] hydrolase
MGHVRRQLADLHHLAAALDGSHSPDTGPPATTASSHTGRPGVWAADLDGARHSSPEFAVISLCRTGGALGTSSSASPT